MSSDTDTDKPGWVYMLWSPHCDKVYVGSTRNMRARFSQHKRRYSAGTSTYKSCDLFDLGFDDVEMIELEYRSCISKEDLVDLEYFWMDLFDPDIVNHLRRKGTCEKKYCERNKEKLAAYQKDYRQANGEKLRAYYNEQIPCECGLFSSRANIARHRRGNRHKDRMAAKETKITINVNISKD